MNGSSEQQQPPPLPVAASPGEAGVLIQGGALVRAENDLITTIAIQRPRSLKRVSDEFTQAIADLPEFAARCRYAIPYAEKKGSSKKVWVTGPTIKFATSLAYTWGNCSHGARRILGENGGPDIAQGVFVDHEKGVRVTREKEIKRVAYRKDRGFVELSPDDYARQVDIDASKAHRNCILYGVPDFVHEPLYGRVVKVIEGADAGVPLAQRFDRAAGTFHEHDARITPEVILSLIDRKAAVDVTVEDIRNLAGLLQSLRSGWVSVERLLALEERPADEESPPGERVVPAPAAEVKEREERVTQAPPPAEPPREESVPGFDWGSA